MLFLLLGISLTVSQDRNDASGTESIQFSKATPEIIGVYEEKTTDRPSLIARLKAAIANNESVIVSEDSVNELEDDIAVGETDSTFTLLKCNETKDAITYARNWPREQVEVSEVEGVRLIAQVEVVELLPTENLLATSSVSSPAIPPLTETIKMELARLPLLPQKLSSPTCLDSEIIGVNLAGELMFNSDAIAYRSRPALELIGYARDGFPIYGSHTGVTDECGGYEVAGQYRYSVGSDRTQFIGCYYGEPQSFIGE